MNQVVVSLEGRQVPLVIETGTLGLALKQMADTSENAAKAQAAAREAEAAKDSTISGLLTKASKNGSDISSGADWRDALGLGASATRNVGTEPGTVAAGDDSRIQDVGNKADKAANLSDLQSASAARDNLALGVNDDVRHQSVVGRNYVAAGGIGRWADVTDPGGILLGRGSATAGPNDAAKIGLDGHPNWVHVETRRIGNPTELIVYSRSLSGRAEGIDGTNVVERIDGDDVTPIAVGDAFYFAGRKLKVTGKPGYGQLAVPFGMRP